MSCRRGYFPYTPATNLLYGLDEAMERLTRMAPGTPAPIPIRTRTAQAA